MEPDISILRRREQNRDAQRRFRAKRKFSKTMARNILEDQQDDGEYATGISHSTPADAVSAPPRFTDSGPSTVSDSSWSAMLEDLDPFDKSDLASQYAKGDISPYSLDLPAVMAAPSLILEQDELLHRSRSSRSTGTEQYRTSGSDTDRQQLVLTAEAIRYTNEVMSLYRTGVLLGLLPKNDEVDYSVQRLVRIFKDASRQDA